MAAGSSISTGLDSEVVVLAELFLDFADFLADFFFPDLLLLELGLPLLLLVRLRAVLLDFALLLFTLFVGWNSKCYTSLQNVSNMRIPLEYVI